LLVSGTNDITGEKAINAGHCGGAESAGVRVGGIYWSE
jgi:hypothetical protein